MFKRLKNWFTSLAKPSQYLLSSIFLSLVTAIWIDINPVGAFSIVVTIWLGLMSICFLVAVLCRVMDNDMKNRDFWS